MRVLVVLELKVQPETWQERWQHRFFGRGFFGAGFRVSVWGWLVAFYAHLAAIIGFAALNLKMEDRRPAQAAQEFTSDWTVAEEFPRLVEIQFERPEVPEGLPVESAPVPIPALEINAPEIEALFPGQNVPVIELPSVPAPTQAPGPKPTPPTPAVATTERKIGGGYEGRTSAARGQLAGTRGGSPASERAVELGLAWLVAHQHADGGWRFDHDTKACNGRCSHPGTHQSTTGATGLALLAFLGAGQTHREGVHQEVVGRGLKYLRSRIVKNSRGADLQEGTMYAQGIATLALCEAYALSNDPELKLPAQQALDFIINVQHPLGGWRYFPGQPGDTTVLGWQLMSLQSGQLAGLQVPDVTLVRAHEFLDRVQAEQGATYGYQSSGDQPTPSAAGLLCRMYRGWKRSDERLQLGIERIASRGPDLQDLYFTYYATQALHHYDGPLWEAWNGNLRDRLIALQEKDGHAAGSWHTPDYHTVAGGRLCDTALAVMILEVYYRHLPLYGYRGTDGP